MSSVKPLSKCDVQVRFFFFNLKHFMIFKYVKNQEPRRLGSHYIFCIN